MWVIVRPIKRPEANIYINILNLESSVEARGAEFRPIPTHNVRALQVGCGCSTNATSGRSGLQSLASATHWWSDIVRTRKTWIKRHNHGFGSRMLMETGCQSSSSIVHALVVRQGWVLRPARARASGDELMVRSLVGFHRQRLRPRKPPPPTLECTWAACGS
jgi:hypothetical protein